MSSIGYGSDFSPHDPLDTPEKMAAAERRLSKRVDMIEALLARKAAGEITHDEYCRLYHALPRPWEME
jgi:hypothetical protein